MYVLNFTIILFYCEGKGDRCIRYSSQWLRTCASLTSTKKVKEWSLFEEFVSQEISEATSSLHFSTQNVGLKSQKSCLEATNLILQNFENQETSLESPGSRGKWLSAYFWAVLLMYPLGRNVIDVNLQYPKSCACFKFVYFLQYIIHLSYSCAAIFISK